MPALKVHVRPPHKHKGLMILCAMYGVCCGVGFAIFTWILDDLSFGPSAGFIIFLVCTFMAPLLGVALYLARYCQHKGPVYLAGQVAGTCYFAGMLLTLFVIDGVMPSVTPWWVYLQMIGVAVGNGVIAGLINLLFRTVCFNGVSVLMEQDGTLCVSCGYCVVHSPSDCCPECGTPRDAPLKSSGRIFRFAELLGSHSRNLKYSAAVILVLAVAGFAYQHAPIWRLKQRFKSECHVQPVTSYTLASGQYGGAASGASACKPLDDDPANRVIIVCYYRRTFFGSYRMLLSLAYHVSMPDGRGGTWTYNQMGNPRVACDLNEEQAAFVVSSGIPESLSDAMIQAADDAAWEPLQQGVQTQLKDGVVVSADGHFSELKKGEE